MAEKNVPSSKEDGNKKKRTDCMGKRQYEVGYGKPPKDSQYRKGVSGNPKGRTKKNRELKATLKRVFSTPVTITIDGKKTSIDGTEAALLQLRAMMSKGDLRAIKLYFDLCRSLKTSDTDSNEQLEGLFAALMAGPVDPKK